MRDIDAHGNWEKKNEFELKAFGRIAKNCMSFVAVTNLINIFRLKIPSVLDKKILFRIKWEIRVSSIIHIDLSLKCHTRIHSGQC